jgi:hypothetical protein
MTALFAFILVKNQTSIRFFSIVFIAIERIYQLSFATIWFSKLLSEYLRLASFDLKVSFSKNLIFNYTSFPN